MLNNEYYNCVELVFPYLLIYILTIINPQLKPWAKGHAINCQLLIANCLFLFPFRLG
jgi:hypothetical protein